MESNRKRFQLSSLSPDVKGQLSKYIKKLGGSYLDTQIFTKQATHIVCGKPNRSEKYLSGCISGRWLLRKEYIEDSYNVGTWLAEEAYEWNTTHLPSEATDEMKCLYGAPVKWKVNLKGKKGAFENWNVIVCLKDNKMKKAYERLLEAGCAKIVQKRPPYHFHKLQSSVTHIFTEPTMKCKEISALERKGIKCRLPDFIPDYILNVPNNQGLAESSLNTNSGLPKQVKSSGKGQKSLKPGCLPGKENGVVEKQREITVKGVKRKAADCDLCLAKRQKKMDVVLPNTGSLVNLNNITEQTATKPLYFPAYVSNLVESYIDEGSILPAISTISSSLSENYAPSFDCLAVVINNFLLEAPTKLQANESYNLLRKILQFHSPQFNRVLYLNAFINEKITEINSFSDFVMKVLRIALNPSNDGSSKRMQDNALLCVQFLDAFLHEDAIVMNNKHRPLLFDLLWSESGTGCNKEFIVECHKCLTQAVEDDSKMFLWQILAGLLELGLSLLKNIDDQTERHHKEAVVQQLFTVLSRNNSNATIKVLVQCCQSSWLKMNIIELILNNYDKQLIPQSNRNFMDKNLSLMKIVTFYFYLLPKTTEKVESQRKLLPRSKTKNLKRNARGETLLHVACIHNNVAKVDELLNGDFDVNATDHAGWTPLHEACNHGHIKCVQKILNYHERTNRVNLLLTPKDGTTVLHDAVINNHLPVVQLLIKSAGLKLLQAQMSCGFTPLDVSQSEEMTDYLLSEINRLKEDEKVGVNVKTQISKEEYDRVLKQSGSLFVKTEDCEHYLFLVSQLLQAYLFESHLCQEDYKKICTNCKNDLNTEENLTDHISSLKEHLQQITGMQALSSTCKLYLETVKTYLM